jgi:hypothetical protein
MRTSFSLPFEKWGVYECVAFFCTLICHYFLWWHENNVQIEGLTMHKLLAPYWIPSDNDYEAWFMQHTKTFQSFIVREKILLQSIQWFETKNRAGWTNTAIQWLTTICTAWSLLWFNVTLFTPCRSFRTMRTPDKSMQKCAKEKHESHNFWKP